MNIFEYVAVLTSIVIGLSITHLLSGLAGIVQHPSRHRVYWTHLAWVAYMFFTVIWWWWWQIALSEIAVWTLGLYLYVITFAVVLYFICALLFPSDLEGYDGYEDYFLSRRKWFFGLLALAYIVDVGDTLLKGMDYFRSLGVEYPLIAFSIIVLCAVASFTRYKLFHATFAVAALASQLYMAIKNFGTIA